MIRLQFSTTPELSSSIIRHICHSPFSHVDVLDAEGNCLGASDSPEAPVIKGNAGGVAIRPANYQEFARRRIAEVRCAPDVEDAFNGFMISQIGKPFDDDAVHAFLRGDVNTDRDWRASDKWFCSELVTWALEQAKLWPYDLLVPKDRVSPADLLLLLNPVMNTETFWLPIPGLKLDPHEK